MNSRRNYPLLLTSQFLGAFGDNFFLWLIIGPLTRLQERGELSLQALTSANALYACLFYAPFVLLAPFAGFLNDRFAKTRWLAGGNAIKLAGVGVGALSLVMGNVFIGAGYFIVGVGACAFSPAKYGILPEILPAERLVKANGTVELLTILAILTGSVGGAEAMDRLTIGEGLGIVAAIYFVALLCAAAMQPTQGNAAVQLRASVGEFTAHFRSLLRSPRLARVLLGTGLFWASGAMLKANFQPWGLDVLQFKNNRDISLLGLWLALGVVLGSVLAGQLHRLGDLRCVRRYGWLMAGFIASLAAVSVKWPQAAGIALLIGAGGAAGLFLIPLNAALQAESDATALGKTIATQNLVDNGMMLIGGGVVFLLAQLGANASQVFLAEAVLLAAAVAVLKVPDKKS